MNDESNQPDQAQPNITAEDNSSMAVVEEDAPSGQPDTDMDNGAPAALTDTEIQWQASEYIQHHKNASWYAIVVVIVIVLSVGGYFLKAWLSIVLFVVMGATVIVFAQRPPRTLVYELSADGLTIDGKLYPFHTFRSFSVFRDVGWHSIDLEPTQRFMPRMSVLFNDDDFDLIVNHFLAYLPRVEREPDFIERATRYLRF